MSEIRSYRDLLVWQKSMSLVTEVYAITSNFPNTEQYGLTSQTRRSAVSVPSNIAEGYGRNSSSDYVRFLRIASGSVYELRTQLEIAQNLSYLTEQDFINFNRDAEEISRILGGLINKVEMSRR